MQENKELYFGYFKHISQNIIFNDYVNLLPLNSYIPQYHSYYNAKAPLSRSKSIAFTSR